MPKAVIEEVEREEPEIQEEEVEEVDVEEPEEESDTETEEADSEEEGELAVSFGDEESPPQEDESKAPAWVKDLRKRSVEKDRKIRELEEKLKASAAPAKAKAELGPKPTLSDCGFDEDEFLEKLEAWQNKKAEIHDLEKKANEKAEAVNKAFFSKVEKHNEELSKLRVKDLEEAKSMVSDSFSELQRNLLIDATVNSAQMLYALAKNPGKLSELSAIENPVHFVAEVVRLETKLKTATTKKAPLPDKTVKGSSGSTSVLDSKMARLEAEAEKSGDRTKVLAYKRELRDKQRK